MQAICQSCKKQYDFRPSQTRGKFCTNKCRGDYTISQRLVVGSTMNKQMRRWIYEHLPQVCGECGMGTEWNKKFLRLQIDHINGNKKDNRRENLRMICPNCHTQTNTWGVKNASPEGKKRMRDGALYLQSKRFQSYSPVAHSAEQRLDKAKAVGAKPTGATTLCTRRQIGMAQDYESCCRKTNAGSSPAECTRFWVRK